MNPDRIKPKPMTMKEARENAARLLKRTLKQLREGNERAKRSTIRFGVAS